MLSEPLLLALVAACAGGLGATLGIGGGIILVPFLTLVLRLPSREAVALSLVGVVATSVAAAANHMRKGLANVRLALVLAPGAALGALLGVQVMGWMPDAAFKVAFAGVLYLLAFVTLWRGGAAPHPQNHTVARVPQGLALVSVSGLLAALAGVGGGVFHVLTMERVMGVPLRVATATSTLIMGLTAAGALLPMARQGWVLWDRVGPLVAGAFLGASFGARWMPRWPPKALRVLFVLVVLIMATRMLWSVVGS
jgi:uncharacterized membrane protein YfcA